MDITEISTLISTVGFPIVACIVLFLQNTKLTEALNNNTVALTELSTLIKGKKDNEQK